MWAKEARMVSQDPKMEGYPTLYSFPPTLEDTLTLYIRHPPASRVHLAHGPSLIAGCVHGVDSSFDRRVNGGWEASLGCSRRCLS